MPINASFPSKDQSNPFQEQLDFFRAKLNLPTERWDDIMGRAHDKAFVVAGAANADLLNDLRGAVDKSIEEGRGLEAFRKDFNAIVLKHGWTGWTGEGSAGGNAWRTRVIYQTNMATSYAAGRWKQLTDPGLLSIRPYWRYVHSDSVMHPRPLHKSWDGIVLPHDHPFWKTHFCPNGWGCQCRICSASAKEYEKAVAAGRAEPPDGWDDIDPKTGAPVGIDKGFDYAPGASASRPLKDFVDQKLISLDAPIGAAMYDAMRPVLGAEMAAGYQDFLAEVLLDPVKRGRIAVVGAMDSSTLEWLAANKQVAPATAEIIVEDGLIVGKKAARHESAGNALSADEWSLLPAMVESPERILYDTRSGKLLYVMGTTDGRDAKLVVEFDFVLKRGMGTRNAIVSGFKVPTEAIDGEIKGGFFEVVK